jgi:hypothetical protein
MTIYNTKFEYNKGKRVGYDISIPDQFGDLFLLKNVSCSDKNKIKTKMNNLLKDLEKNDPFYIYEPEDLIVERNVF